MTQTKIDVTHLLTSHTDTPSFFPHPPPLSTLHRITISLNVNHTVDTEDGQVAEMNTEQTEGVLKSRPSFEVDIAIGPKTLSFTCSYTAPGDLQGDGQEAGEGECVVRMG